MSKPARQSDTPSSASSWIQDLAKPVTLASLGPIAGRFVYSLRLIALHERVKRDPVRKCPCFAVLLPAPHP